MRIELELSEEAHRFVVAEAQRRQLSVAAYIRRLLENDLGMTIKRGDQ